MIEDLKGMKETIAYGSSQFRLMKNQETEDYPPHWHTSIEIIMPLENGYQAVIGNECYTLNPLDLLFINSGEIHSLQAPATGKRLIFQAPLSLFYSIFLIFFWFNFVLIDLCFVQYFLCFLY